MASRPRHKKPTKANRMRELFKNLSQEQLQDMDVLWGLVKKARLKTNSSDVYRIRNEFVTTEEAPSQDILKSIMLVKRTAEQVGGLDELKNLVSIIERVRQ